MTQVVDSERVPVVCGGWSDEIGFVCSSFGNRRRFVAWPGSRAWEACVDFASTTGGAAAAADDDDLDL
ncbi:unnamed protein product [Lampetra planeri]